MPTYNPGTVTASLEKRIRGDWFDLRELGSRFFSINEYFGFSQPALRGLIDRLLSVRDGVVGLKRQIISDVCYALDDLNYQSVTGEEIGRLRAEIEVVLFLGMLQRLVTSQKAEDPEEASEEEPSLDDVEVKTILEDVRERVAANPEMERNPAVKAIFLQMKMYQQEVRTMRELAPKLAEDKKRQLLRNFQTKTDGLFEAVRRNYGTLLQQDRRSAGPTVPKALLARLDLGDLTTYLTNQLKHVSTIRSTLTFAEQERYQVRQMLVEIAKGRQQSVEMIDRERRGYEDVCAQADDTVTDCAQRLDAEFREELVRVLKRHFLRQE